MSWDRIAHQPTVVAFLRQAVVSDRLAHAYIFTGPPGTGKQAAAMSLAATLHCPERPLGSACGDCSSCRRVWASAHPDILELAPEGATFRRDRVMEAQRWLAMQPLDSQHRVVIMHRAEAFTAEAANAALKMLEEPPPYAVLLLLTANAAALLPTIRSRCQQVVFPPVAETAVAELLVAEGIAPDQARFLAALAGGSPVRARELAQQTGLTERHERVRSWLTGAGGLDDAACLERVDALDPNRTDMLETLDMMLLYLRDAAVTVVGARVSAATPDTRLVHQLAGLGLPTLLAMVDAVSETRSALDRNANVKLALDVLMLRLASAQVAPTM